MEKSFEGITKKDLQEIFLTNENKEIIIIYTEVYDTGCDSSIKFTNDICVENSEENRSKIEEAFGIKYCWCECYDEEGKKVYISGLFPDYETFYEYVDFDFGYDVVNDGDN